jgi:hypothetical protein
MFDSRLATLLILEMNFYFAYFISDNFGIVILLEENFM